MRTIYPITVYKTYEIPDKRVTYVILSFIIVSEILDFKVRESLMIYFENFNVLSYLIFFSKINSIVYFIMRSWLYTEYFMVLGKEQD